MINEMRISEDKSVTERVIFGHENSGKRRNHFSLYGWVQLGRVYCNIQLHICPGFMYQGFIHRIAIFLL